MKIYLTIPNKDLNLAKKRGARFCNIYKKYYVNDPLHIDLYMHWNPEYLTEKGFQNLESGQTDVSK